jgi:hypothetical protein
MLTLEMENLSGNYPIIDLVYHLLISTFSDFLSAFDSINISLCKHASMKSFSSCICMHAGRVFTFDIILSTFYKI